jgi:hydroxyethylthiazole kinase
VEIPSASDKGCKGVDSTASSDDAKSHGASLARAFQCIVAISGKTDYITDGSRVIACSNGTAMLTKITAAGCSLSCLCAAYCAVAGGRFLEAVAAAFAHFGTAAEIAEARPEVPARTPAPSADGTAAGRGGNQALRSLPGPASRTRAAHPIRPR